MRNSSETINILRVSKICIMQWQNRNNKRIVRITWNHFLFLLWWKEQKICYQVKIIFYNQENITKQTKFRNIFTRTWKWTYLQLACTSLQSQNCTLLSHPSLQTQKSLGLEPDTSFFFFTRLEYGSIQQSVTPLSHFLPLHRNSSTPIAIHELHILIEKTQKWDQLPNY